MKKDEYERDLSMRGNGNDQLSSNEIESMTGDDLSSLAVNSEQGSNDHLFSSANRGQNNINNVRRRGVGLICLVGLIKDHIMKVSIVITIIIYMSVGMKGEAEEE
jgi:hypothetical protein